MSLKERFVVEQIPFQRVKEWVLKKHYARRIPSVSYSFGIYEMTDNQRHLRGIACFGVPVAHFPDQPDWFRLIEFNRLVLEEPHEKNLGSFFVGKVISIFPEKPVLLVSYADTNLGHHGYIYQATNWLYTGESADTGHGLVLVDGVEMHAKTVFNKYKTNDYNKMKETGMDFRKSDRDLLPKHRYFFLIGTRKEKKNMLGWLAAKYEILSYPKGDNSYYDSSFKPASVVGFGIV